MQGTIASGVVDFALSLVVAVYPFEVGEECQED